MIDPEHLNLKTHSVDLCAQQRHTKQKQGEAGQLLRAAQKLEVDKT